MSNLRKLKEVDAALEGESSGHSVGSLVAVVAAVHTYSCSSSRSVARACTGTRGLRPGGVEESRGTRSSQSATRLLYR